MSRSIQKSPENQAQSLLDELKISGVPIPVQRIARYLGAQIRLTPLDDELSGMVFLNNGKPVIGINSLHHPNRQRFTLAHEIAHLCLHQDCISNAVHVDKQFKSPMLRRDTSSAAGTEKMEIEANQFAAALLVPATILEDIFDSPEFDLVDETPIEEWAKKLRVSKAMLDYRIKNYLKDKYSSRKLLTRR